jgi:hypothetical protein
MTARRIWPQEVIDRIVEYVRENPGADGPLVRWAAGIDNATTGNRLLARLTAEGLIAMVKINKRKCLYYPAGGTSRLFQGKSETIGPPQFSRMRFGANRRK